MAHLKFSIGGGLIAAQFVCANAHAQQLPEGIHHYELTVLNRTDAQSNSNNAAFEVTDCGLVVGRIGINGSLRGFAWGLTALARMTAFFLVFGSSTLDASASIVGYTTPSAWAGAVVSPTTIGAADIPINEVITNQWEPLGMVVSETWLYGMLPTPAYHTAYGWWGLSLDTPFMLQQGQYFTLDLTESRQAFAATFFHVGWNWLELWSDGVLIGETPQQHNMSTSLHYVGVTSDQAFDRVVFRSSTLSGNADRRFFNFSFASVPAPGALSLFAIAAGCARRRRARVG